MIRLGVAWHSVDWNIAKFDCPRYTEEGRLTSMKALALPYEEVGMIFYPLSSLRCMLACNGMKMGLSPVTAQPTNTFLKHGRKNIVQLLEDIKGESSWHLRVSGLYDIMYLLVLKLEIGFLPFLFHDPIHSWTVFRTNPTNHYLTASWNPSIFLKV